MEFLIVTGMSGAGKSQAANALEDMGYYCVDNIPPAIIPSLVELSARSDSHINKLAIVTDTRGGNMFVQISEVLENLKKSFISYKILYLNCNDDVLIRRYKENRRTHHLCDRLGLSLEDAVQKEREMLSVVHEIADYVVDTTELSNSQLKEHLREIFFGSKLGGFKIVCKSFGFKYGIDAEADIVFDVRFLPNPFYIDDLKHKTGLDEAVPNYIMGFEQSHKFKRKVLDMIDFTLPLYIKEGKSRLVIAFGCTGGKHRSVTFAEILNKHLLQLGYDSSTHHRDIEKY